MIGIDVNSGAHYNEFQAFEMPSNSFAHAS